MAANNPLIRLCVAASLFAGGCASNKIGVLPAAKPVLVPETNSAFYMIQKVDVSFSAAPPEWQSGIFSGRFARLAAERHPGLFRNSAEATPIAVRIEVRQSAHDGVALVAFMGTLGILGGVLPSLPWSTEWQVQMQVQDLRGAPLFSTGIEAEHRGWWSLVSPLGLIPIPGESDVPKVSTFVTGGPGIVPEPFRDYVAECLADHLAAELLKQDFSLLPSQPFTAPSGQIPTSLPLPTGTPAPF